MGRPVRHSLSPILHVTGAKLIGKKCLSFGCDISRGDLPELVETMRGLTGFIGFNVTMPYKSDIMQHVDRLSPDARAIGAINTVVKRDGQLVGENTDWMGFREVLYRKTGFHTALILGAGGAAAAAAYALLSAPEIASEILVLNRSEEGYRRMTWLGGGIKRYSGERFELLVNATPEKAETLVGERAVTAAHMVIDFDYSRDHSSTQSVCARRGICYTGGLELLVRQGVYSLELFFGRRPAYERLYEEIRRYLTWRDAAFHTAH